MTGELPPHQTDNLASVANDLGHHSKTTLPLVSESNDVFYDCAFDIMVSVQSVPTEESTCWCQEVLVESREAFWAHTAGGSYFPERLCGCLLWLLLSVFRLLKKQPSRSSSADDEDFPCHSDSSASDAMLNGGGLENQEGHCSSIAAKLQPGRDEILQLLLTLRTEAQRTKLQ